MQRKRMAANTANNHFDENFMKSILLAVESTGQVD